VEKKGHYNGNDQLVIDINRVYIMGYMFQQPALLVAFLLKEIQQRDDNAQTGDGFPDGKSKGLPGKTT
jgi:hypothetical protein